jgi:hypothetical protein
MQLEAEVEEAEGGGASVVFPSKNLVSFGYLDASGLEQRVQDLQLFVNSLLKVPLRQSSQRQIMFFLSEGATERTNIRATPSDGADGQSQVQQKSTASTTEVGGRYNQAKDGEVCEGQEGKEPTKVMVAGEDAGHQKEQQPPAGLNEEQTPRQTLVADRPPSEEAGRGEAGRGEDEEGGEEEDDEFSIDGMTRRFTSFFSDETDEVSFDVFGKSESPALELPKPELTGDANGSPEDDFSLDVISRRLTDFTSIMLPNEQVDPNEISMFDTLFGTVLEEGGEAYQSDRSSPDDVQDRASVAATGVVSHLGAQEDAASHAHDLKETVADATAERGQGRAHHGNSSEISQKRFVSRYDGTVRHIDTAGETRYAHHTDASVGMRGAGRGQGQNGSSQKGAFNTSQMKHVFARCGSADAEALAEAATASGASVGVQVCTCCWARYHRHQLSPAWQRFFHCKRNALRALLRLWRERALAIAVAERVLQAAGITGGGGRLWALLDKGSASSDSSNLDTGGYSTAAACGLFFRLLLRIRTSEACHSAWRKWTSYVHVVRAAVAVSSHISKLVAQRLHARKEVADQDCQGLPDQINGDWTNAVLQGSWVFAKEALRDSIAPAIQALLQKHQPDSVDRLRVARLDLGGMPPVCKRFEAPAGLNGPEAKSVTLLLGFVFEADESMQAEVLVEAAGTSSSILVTDLELEGQLRIELSPLTSQW